jgi:hypothetical protein
VVERNLEQFEFILVISKIEKGAILLLEISLEQTTKTFSN